METETWPKAADSPLLDIRQLWVFEDADYE